MNVKHRDPCRLCGGRVLVEKELSAGQVQCRCERCGHGRIVIIAEAVIGDLSITGGAKNG